MVLAILPYGARGVSITEDPDCAYREKSAYSCSLCRALGPSAAYRLPSAIFPGAMLVNDLPFFRARGA